MSYSVGSLVRARSREWIVLPESEQDFLILRPIGGTEDEIVGISTILELVEPARFDLPDPNQIGDYRSCRLLRDAIRLGFRSSAGPFRSFAKIGVEPRPYQLVPLLMALKLDPVRLLIADDVGVGKTVEAGLVVRELLDRGEANRFAVLCPPHLAEQWQAELEEKFHIPAELVLPGTASRLERHLRIGESLFDHYPYVIVSMEYIKADRRRDEFIRTCPELVIVDEAHSCAFADVQRGGRHQRNRLVNKIAQDPNRHLILVTATPHSGNEGAFRSLLSFLDPAFANLPAELSGPQNVPYRRKLAAHFVQRRRADIRHYMKTDTPFPIREDREETYTLGEHSEYRRLFNRVLDYARETVQDQAGSHYQHRVRWLSALALLRSLASSPAAAAATLRNRAASADASTPEEVDEIGRRTVLDMDQEDIGEVMDLIPGSDPGDENLSGDETNALRRRLLAMARDAAKLAGDKDEKFKKASSLIKELLDDHYNPIVFCRFIPTAEYVAEQLRRILPNDTAIAAVTGTLPPAEREERIIQLAENPKRVLVCTDCLSEGINLQNHFDAVMHYDLTWNPTRHEQREGRVDRFGQAREKIRILTYYGTDNQIDGIVLDVLIRKHKTIRTTLGISVPVPVDSGQVIEAIFEGLILREKASGTAHAQEYLPGLEELFKPQKNDLFKKWDDATAREKRSRTMFAQESIKVDEVMTELQAVQAAVGLGSNVRDFVLDAFTAHNGLITEKKGVYQFDLTEAPMPLKEILLYNRPFQGAFDMPVPEGVAYLNRTHPVVEALASYVMNSSLDPLLKGIARRCGVTYTSQVQRRTTLILARFRYYIITTRNGIDSPLLAEDCRLLGFAGAPENAEWLDDECAEKLILSDPEMNISPDRAVQFVTRVIEGVDHRQTYLEKEAYRHGEELLEAHRRVRTASRLRGVKYRVEPHLPPDILGIYVYLPMMQP
jgi:superfamily II DNA or RNA helicase